MRRFSITTIVLMVVSSFALANQAFQDYRQGNYEKAKSPLMSMAKKNKPSALYYLGMMNLYGYAIAKNTSKGLSYIERSAEKGYSPAQVFMAVYNLQKKNNPARAFHWFEKAANKGYVSAQLYVASAYMHGYGVKKSIAKARRYIIKAAKKGNALAQYSLGRYYLGQKRYKTKKIGFTWLNKSAEKGNLDAQVTLARAYLSIRGDIKRADYWLNKVEHSPDDRALMLIGDYYMQSDHFSEKLNALSWYKRAAEKGNTLAKYKVGLMYLAKDLKFYNPGKGVQWVKEAAKEGNGDAQKTLAKMYKQGIDVATDMKKSNYWETQYKNNAQKYRRQRTLDWLASDKNNAGLLVEFNLAGILHDWKSKFAKANGKKNLSPKMKRLSEKQIFTPQLSFTSPKEIPIADVVMSLSPRSRFNKNTIDLPFNPIEIKKPTANVVKRIYSQALLGDRQAQYRMGQLLDYGKGVVQDSKQALLWYYKAAAQNHLRAEYNIALIFLQGRGVSKDYPRAVYWLNRSAFKGNPNAQYLLGRLYESGFRHPDSVDMIKQDKDFAKSMYHLASSEKHPKAMLSLADIYSSDVTSKRLTVAEKRERFNMLRKLYDFASAQGLKEADLPLAFYYAHKGVSRDKQEWAFSIAKSAANQGNGKAALLVGLMYDRGIGVRKDKWRAIDWYQLALKRKQPLAQYILGTYYYNGHGVSANKQKGEQLLAEAASKGIPEAYYNLAYIRKQNHEDYMPFIKNAANLGYPKASLYLADKIMLSAKDNKLLLKDAVDIYQGLSSKGVGSANLKLGYLYDKGIYFKKNYKKAARYYSLASQENNPIAQYLYGHLFHVGKLGYTDIHKANTFYKKAAKSGLINAYVALGFNYETYLHNYKEAKKWYKLAAVKNDPKAQFNLALLYDYGKGMMPDTNEAIHFYKEAAKNNIHEAQLVLADHYFKDRQTSRNVSEAYKWYELAVKRNKHHAAYRLAMMYEAGLGGKADINKAHRYYDMASRSGNRRASLALARMYELGSGVQPSAEKAYSFYTKAKERGSLYAKYKVAQMKLQGHGTDKDVKASVDLLKALADKGYQPAKYALNRMHPDDKRYQSLSLKKSKVKLHSIKTLVRRGPNQMYIEAIKYLNQGKVSSSKKVLDEIAKHYPSFRPAKEMRQSIPWTHES